MTEGPALDFELYGHCLIPDGTVPVAGMRNWFLLPTGQVISIYAVIEMASGEHADDHRDLGFHEASALGLSLELQDRIVDLAPPDGDLLT